MITDNHRISILSNTTQVMSIRPSFSMAFPKPHIINPISEHKYTVLALHGLNSTGEIFANRLGISRPKLVSQSKPIPKHDRPGAWLDKIPTQNIRFVFPTAPVRRIDAPPLALSTHAWFKVSSFTDLEVHQDEQIPGLSESINYISDLVEEETATLRQQNRTDQDLFILARSQGSSVTGWLLATRLQRAIGGVVLTGSWLVLARALQKALKERYRSDEGNSVNPSDQDMQIPRSALDFSRELVGSKSASDVLSTIPVLMGHSIDDVWINVKLGRQFRDVLRVAGGQVQWNEYLGADDDGHWFKEPEEFDAIAGFLLKHMRP